MDVPRNFVGYKLVCDEIKYINRSPLCEFLGGGVYKPERSKSRLIVFLRAVKRTKDKNEVMIIISTRKDHHHHFQLLLFLFVLFSR